MHQDVVKRLSLPGTESRQIVREDLAAGASGIDMGTAVPFYIADVELICDNIRAGPGRLPCCDGCSHVNSVVEYEAGACWIVEDHSLEDVRAGEDHGASIGRHVEA